MWIINLKIKVRIGKEYQQTGSTVTRPHVTQFTAHASLVAENHLHWWSLTSASFFQQGFVVFWWWSCVFGHYSDVGWFQFWGFDAFICRHQLTHSEDVWVDYIPAVFCPFLFCCHCVTFLWTAAKAGCGLPALQNTWNHFVPGHFSVVIVITAVGGSYSKPYWLSFRVNTELLAFNKKPHQVVSWPLTHSCILRHSHIETERQTNRLFITRDIPVMSFWPS